MPFSDIIGHAAPISWLQQAISSKHLAHAYLFVGEEAIGKKLTALRVAQTMCCDQIQEGSNPDPCGICQPCYQIETRIHPDFLDIQPDAETQNPQIKIDRVREIEHHVIYRPLMGTRKICLIDAADRMTLSAANALLKTLEEPPDHCLFLLVTSRPSLLLPTLVSRCLVVRFAPPSPGTVKNYLMEQKDLPESEARLISFVSEGRLGEALHMDAKDTLTRRGQFLALLSPGFLDSLPNLLDTAEALSKGGEALKNVSGFWPILRDLLLITQNCDSNHIMYPEDFETLQSLAKRTSASALLRLLDELQSLEQGLPRNLNLQLGFERFLIHLRQALAA